MDLLTQPLVHHPVASRSPPAQSPSSVAGATGQEGGASIGKHVSTDSQASIESTTEHREQDASHFAQLRTAATLDTTGLEHEPRIVSPSHANGDWRVYGRVKAQCIFWHEGTLQEKGLGAAWKKSREKLDQVHEWVADGTLWITKTGEIVFVLDQHSAPTLVDRPPAKAQTLSTGSSETGEHASTTHPRRLSLSSLRRLSSRDSHSAATVTATSTQETPATTEHAENEGGIRGFVHKIVSAISPSSHHQELPSTGELPAGETSGDGLRRVSTREAQAAQASRAEVAAGKQPEGTEAPSASTTAGASTAVQFEEPHITDDPLPAYKGHVITALVIGSASHIRAIRHFPLSSAETTSPSNLALSSTGSQDFLSVGGEMINPPVVELDVVEWVAPADGKDAFDEENTMIRKREVTVGFAFRDVLLLHEADDFRARVEALVTTAMQAERATTPTHSLGAALMRTLSGRSLGRATSHEGSTGERAAVVQQQQQQQQQPMAVQQPQQQQQELPPSVPVPAPEPQEARPETLAHGRRRSGSWLKAHPQGDVWT